MPVLFLKSADCKQHTIPVLLLALQLQNGHEASLGAVSRRICRNMVLDCTFSGFCQQQKPSPQSVSHKMSTANQFRSCLEALIFSPGFSWIQKVGISLQRYVRLDSLREYRSCQITIIQGEKCKQTCIASCNEA